MSHVLMIRFDDTHQRNTPNSLKRYRYLSAYPSGTIVASWQIKSADFLTTYTYDEVELKVMEQQKQQYNGEDQQQFGLTCSRADTHLHTNLGDGWSSPKQVIYEALRHHLRVIAVTDHDHIEGSKRVAELLAQQPVPLELITGVE